MKQRSFEALHEPRWQRFATLLGDADSRGAPLRKARVAERVADFPALYRGVCRDLSMATERGYSPGLLDRLNRLVLAGHRQLYARDFDAARGILRFIAVGFARRVRLEFAFIAWSTALLVVPGLAVALAIGVQPELVYSVLPADSLREFEAMYDPHRARVGTLRDAGTDIQMLGFYVLNNIGIAFRMFAGGVALCVGSALALTYNGLVLGAVTAHVVELGYGETFFPFVIGHGAFELTAIAIAGAAGLKLGWALWAPGPVPRLRALRDAARGAVELVYGATGMLLIAAFLEAFWSSKSMVDAWLRIAVGALLWALVIGYFVWGARRSAGGARTGEA